jgi:hypothetical protein
MKNKVIPFPASSQSIPPGGLEGSHRVLVRLGSQRIALDLTCRAILLPATPAPTGVPPVHAVDRKRRKERTR